LLARAQDKYHLYFLFDLMNGGDLMDVLVAEAKVIKRRIPQGTWRRACFAPKARRPRPLLNHEHTRPGHTPCLVTVTRRLQPQVADQHLERT